MLTEAQIYSLINDVLLLPCSRILHLDEGKNGIIPNPARHSWKIRFAVNGIDQPWYIETVDDTVRLIRMNSNKKMEQKVLSVNIDPNHGKISLQPDAKMLLTETICSNGNTLATLIQSIIFNSYMLRESYSEHYNDIYPNIENYISDVTNDFDIYVKLDNSPMIPINALGAPSPNTKIFQTPLFLIPHALVDIYGKRKETRKDYDPLFHIVIDNGVIGLTRYTKKQAPPYPGRTTAVADNEPTAKLSNKTSQIDISEIGDSAIDIMRAVRQVITDDFKVCDSLNGQSSFTAGGSIAVIGYMASIKNLNDYYKKLKNVSSDLFQLRHTDPNAKNGAGKPAYAIDEFSSVYQSPHLDVHISITENNTHTRRGESDIASDGTVSITYSDRRFGNIAVLHIQPDRKFIVDRQLNNTANLFFIPSDSIVAVQFTDGNQGLRTFTVRINKAFELIRSTIAMCAAISDIQAIVDDYTHRLKGSTKVMQDTTNVYTLTAINVRDNSMPTATISIQSRMNDVNALKVNLEYTADSDAITCMIVNGSNNKYDIAGDYNTSIDGNLLYDEGIDLLRSADKNAAKKTVGGKIASYVFNYIAINKSSKLVDNTDHPTTNMTRSMKFNKTTDMGRLLLNVMDAFNNTFGKNIELDPQGEKPHGEKKDFIGPSRDNKGFSGAYFSKFISGLNKKTNTVDSNKRPVYLAIMAECSIQDGFAGVLVAGYTPTGPAVYCNFDQLYKRVDPLVDGKLSDSFLNWYLGAMQSQNAIAQKILRLIDRGDKRFEKFLPYIESGYFHPEPYSEDAFNVLWEVGGDADLDMLDNQNIYLSHIEDWLDETHPDWRNELNDYGGEEHLIDYLNEMIPNWAEYVDEYERNLVSWPIRKDNDEPVDDENEPRKRDDDADLDDMVS